MCHFFFRLNSTTSAAEYRRSMQQLDNQEIQEVIALIKNSADFLNAINWLPKGFLWAGKLPVFISGLLGTISSSMGILATLVTMWETWICSLLLKNAIIFARFIQIDIPRVTFEKKTWWNHAWHQDYNRILVVTLRMLDNDAVTLAPRGRKGVQSDRMSYHLWSGNCRKGSVFSE